LQDALLRNARFIVGIEMHTGKMSFRRGGGVFPEGRLSVQGDGGGGDQARTGDPTYLYYTLGKLEIMKLREDMKKKQGAAFRWRSFTTIS
jgi:hypothetical protein